MQRHHARARLAADLDLAGRPGLPAHVDLRPAGRRAQADLPAGQRAAQPRQLDPHPRPARARRRLAARDHAAAVVAELGGQRGRRAAARQRDRQLEHGRAGRHDLGLLAGRLVAERDHLLRRAHRVGARAPRLGLQQHDRERDHEGQGGQPGGEAHIYA